MSRIASALAAFIFFFSVFANSQTSGHYLFAWTGDLDKKGNDFLTVIDADPQSLTYGKLVTTLPTDQQTMEIHHTEYVMPEGGMLFANDHEAGRTFIFDLRDALHPKLVTSFTDRDGYMHPHSYQRLPNGHVLVTFQHAHRDMQGLSGGLVELDDRGNVIRSAASADSAFPNALLWPYGLVPLADIDRVLVTNSSMHDQGIFSGVTYQVFRLSDLKLLKTSYFDVGSNHYSHISPEEPRRGPDGSVYVQTLGCGIERVTDIATDKPKSKIAYQFPGNWCGVPTIVSHFLIQSVPDMHGVIVLDIANGDHPVEVSRLQLTADYSPHWTGYDAKTQRVVVTGGQPRLFLLKFDPQTGAIAFDEAFHDDHGAPGFDFANRDWPQGWKGSGKPHGVVFSR
ncbi:MAG TPA: hypothetical protein VGL89_14015 [Candidatus Koribacter sp.]|jgi:hypothetical protein